MLNIKYHLLCSIFVEHDFYSDGLCRDILLMPTHESIQKLREYELIIKQIEGKLLIFQRVEAAQQPETPFDIPIRLCFFAFLQNPQLANLCDTGTVTKERFYLTNVAQDGTLRTQLTEQAALSAQDIMPLTCAKRFFFDFEKGQFQQLHIERFGRNGWELVELKAVNADQEGLEMTLPTSGKYRLTKQPLPAGESAQLLVVEEDTSRHASMWGMVELFLDHTVGFGTEYTLKITNRLLPWQYVLIDVKSKKVQHNAPNGVHLNFTRHPLDTLSPVPTTFTHKPVATLSAQQQAMIANLKTTHQDTIQDIFVFESDNALPILENRPPTVKFALDAQTIVMGTPTIDTLQVSESKAIVFFNV